MRRTETFRLQHAELACYADRIEQLFDTTQLVADANAARALMTDFVRVLTHHSEQEDERLYPLLFKHDDEKIRDLARGLHAEFGIIYAAVEVFISVWTRDGALEAEPHRFIDEATAILQTLRRRIAMENDVLYGAIDGL